MFQKLEKFVVVAIFVIILITACSQTQNLVSADTPQQAPSALPEVKMPPLPTGEKFQSDTPKSANGKAFVEKVEILVLESYPPQFRLRLVGQLPNPCAKLVMMVDPPDKNNKITLHVGSQSQSGEICAQVLQPFDEQIKLETLKTGKYTVWLDGQQVGEIQMP
jgi:hypothetical protein